jgi:hypothetical protein
MSDSTAQTTRQLKIKTGVVKRYVPDRVPSGAWRKKC